MAKSPAPKTPAPKKEKNPPPPEDDDDDDDLGVKKGGEKEAGASSKDRGKLKLIILIAATVVLSIGGTVGVLKIFGSGSQPEPRVESHGATDAAEPGVPPVAPQRPGGGHGQAPETLPGAGPEGGEAGFHAAAFNVEFKPFIVNLTDVGGRRMLKLTMSVEAETQELADEINAKMPQFRDTVLLLLSSIQSDDVAGLDGKQRLKNQMINRINLNLTRGKIRNLYFSEIVVQ